jgi:hypothetical protein
VTIAGYPIERDEIPVDLPADFLATLRDGPQSAGVAVTVTVSNALQQNAPPLHKTTVTPQGSWTLTPASSPSLTIDNSIQKNTLKEMAARTTASFAGKGAFLFVNGDYSQWTPYPFAFRVYVRGEGREWEVGRAAALLGKVSLELRPFNYARAGFPLGGWEFPPVVDVVIRPSDEDAVRTIECTKIWHGEIVIPNVPVQ